MTFTFANWLFIVSAIGVGIFVGSLINAVFQLIFDASVEEMRLRQLRGGR